MDNYIYDLKKCAKEINDLVSESKICGFKFFMLNRNMEDIFNERVIERISYLEKESSKMCDLYLSECKLKGVDFNKVKVIESLIENFDNGSFIYFIKDENDCVKIGKTTNLKNRKSGLCTGSSGKLEYLAIIYCPSEIITNDSLELICHEYFKKHHVKGEWFDISKNDVCEFISSFFDCSVIKESNNKSYMIAIADNVDELLNEVTYKNEHNKISKYDIAYKTIQHLIDLCYFKYFLYDYSYEKSLDDLITTLYTINIFNSLYGEKNKPSIIDNFKIDTVK